MKKFLVLYDGSIKESARSPITQRYPGWSIFDAEHKAKVFRDSLKELYEKQHGELTECCILAVDSV
jgi:hypothetical protein